MVLQKDNPSGAPTSKAGLLSELKLKGEFFLMDSFLLHI
jgi:hypothetical protein